MKKFKYLITSLADQAKQATERVQLSEMNYGISIRVMQARLGSNARIVNEHLDNLLAIPPVRSPSDVAVIRHIYNNVQAHTDNLEGLEVLPTLYAILLHSLLMASLHLTYRINKKQATTTLQRSLTKRRKLNIERS